MGIPVSVLSLPSREHNKFPLFEFEHKSGYETESSSELEFFEENHKLSLFDKLYVYPVFATDLRVQQKLLNKTIVPLKPIVMYGHYPEKHPLVIELGTVLKSLDPVGDLEKNSSILSTLFVAQYIESEFTVNYAYGFSHSTGKCYFYKEGNFNDLILKISHGENLHKTNTSSRKVFLSCLHKLMNTLTGSVWLNGYCINGPENPRDRIQVESIRIRSIPARVTIWVEDLIGIHCIRTRTRLEIYGKTREKKTKAIWFRGEFANSLIVTEVEGNVMSVLIPAYCQEAIDNQNIIPCADSFIS